MHVYYLYSDTLFIMMLRISIGTMASAVWLCKDDFYEVFINKFKTIEGPNRN